jgi:hypothetical protein
MRLFRCTLRGQVRSTVFANVFHVAADTPFDTLLWTWTSAPSPEDIADELDSKLTTTYRSLIPSAGKFIDITVEDEIDPAHPENLRDGFVKTKDLVGTGTFGTTTLPTSACMVWTLQSGHIGRSTRGRWFAPPYLDALSVTNGVLDNPSTRRTSHENFLKALVPAFSGGDLWPTVWVETWEASVGIFSKTRKARGQTPYFFPITAYKTDGKLHWLRSRAEGEA